MKTPVTFSVSYFIKAQKVKGNHVSIYAKSWKIKTSKETIAAMQTRKQGRHSPIRYMDSSEV